MISLSKSAKFSESSTQRSTSRLERSQLDAARGIAACSITSKIKGATGSCGSSSLGGFSGHSQNDYPLPHCRLVHLEIEKQDDRI